MIVEGTRRYSTRSGGKGLIAEQTSLVLVKILSFIKQPDFPLQAMVRLRATNKSLKAKVENNVEFGLPFLKLLGINISAAPWQLRLANTPWIDVCRVWANTPHSIIALDYSGSMDTRGFWSMHGKSHLEIAQEILSDLYYQQQQKLRPETTVYVFAKIFLKFTMNEEKHLTRLIEKIANNELPIDRRKTNPQMVFADLFSKENLSFCQAGIRSNFEIKLISDQDFTPAAIEESIVALCTASGKKMNRKSNFTLQLISTSNCAASEPTWQIMSQMLNSSKRKNRIKLILDLEQASKRQKIDLEENPPIVADDILTPPNSPPNTPPLLMDPFDF